MSDFETVVKASSDDEPFSVVEISLRSFSKEADIIQSKVRSFIDSDRTYRSSLVNAFQGVFRNEVVDVVWIFEAIAEIVSDATGKEHSDFDGLLDKATIDFLCEYNKRVYEKRE